MNWDQIKGNWKQLKGKAQKEWGKLTDDDLKIIEGEQILTHWTHPGALWLYPRTGREGRGGLACSQPIVNALYAMEFCAGEVMSDFAGLFQLKTPYLGYWLFWAA